jgi:hypothetical protein
LRPGVGLVRLAAFGRAQREGIDVTDESDGGSAWKDGLTTHGPEQFPIAW